MNRRKLTLLSCILLLLPLPMVAQDSGPANNLPAILRSGLEAYKNNGHRSPFRRGSRVDRSKAAEKQ